MVQLYFGILFSTCIAMSLIFAYQFIPNKRLNLFDLPELSSSVFYDNQKPIGSSGYWVDNQKGRQLHCDIKKSIQWPYCGARFELTTQKTGLDFSNFERIYFDIDYQSDDRADDFRISLHSFDEKLAQDPEKDATKIHELQFSANELSAPFSVNFDEFNISQWWAKNNNLPRSENAISLTNISKISIEALHYSKDATYNFTFNRIELVGFYISQKDYYLYVICAWLGFNFLFLTFRILMISLKNQAQDKLINELSVAQIKAQLQSEKYKQLSITDNLTHLLNRHGFQLFLDEILKQPQYPISSILVIDIDHFKKINDTYGHNTGDYVLQNLADIMKSTLRESDCICRWGGEEFLIAIMETDKQKTMQLSEKLRHSIESQTFIFNNQTIHVTISIGIAVGTLHSQSQFDQLFKSADKALYQAKQQGRNQFLVGN